MSLNNFDGVEIPDSLLESIAGGVLDETTMAVAYQALSALKANGTTKQRACEIFSLTDDPQKRADVLAYIDEIWETL